MKYCKFSGRKQGHRNNAHQVLLPIKNDKNNMMFCCFISLIVTVCFSVFMAVKVICDNVHIT